MTLKTHTTHSRGLKLDREQTLGNKSWLRLNNWVISDNERLRCKSFFGFLHHLILVVLLFLFQAIIGCGLWLWGMTCLSNTLCLFEYSLF